MNGVFFDCSERQRQLARRASLGSIRSLFEGDVDVLGGECIDCVFAVRTRFASERMEWSEISHLTLSVV